MSSKTFSFALSAKITDVELMNSIRSNADFFAKVLNASSDNARKNFKADWVAWSSWIELNGGMERFAADPDGQLNLLIGYADYLAGKGLKAQTIRRRLSGLSSILKILEVDAGVSSAKFKFYTKNLLQTLSSPSKQAEPLSFEKLSQITLMDYRKNIRTFRAVVLVKVAFDSLCRASELSDIRQSNIRFNKDGTGTLFVRKSKNDQAAIGSYRFLSKSTMMLVNEWVELAKAAGRTKFLFGQVSAHSNAIRKIKPDGVEKPISYNSILGAMKEFGSEFSAHSTRVGALLELLNKGYREYDIQMAGGWKSTAMISYYGRSTEVSSGAMARFWEQDNKV